MVKNREQIIKYIEQGKSSYWISQRFPASTTMYYWNKIKNPAKFKRMIKKALKRQAERNKKLSTRKIRVDKLWITCDKLIINQLNQMVVRKYHPIFLMIR